MDVHPAYLLTVYLQSEGGGEGDGRFSLIGMHVAPFLPLPTPLSISLSFLFVVVAIRTARFPASQPYLICWLRFSRLYFLCLMYLILTACELSVPNTIPPFPFALAVVLQLLSLLSCLPHLC